MGDLATLHSRLGRIDELIETTLKAARIPGAALAVVANGAVVHARGYGWRDLSAKLPMNARTVYPIASTTKPVNATLIGMLTEQQILDWDTPVQRYVPGFRLRDAVISTRVTLRDLVTMRTGLPRHDWVWLGAQVTRAELMQKLPLLELSADFRQRFQYCNLSAIVAGHVAEVVTGKRWEALVQQRIFAPLGMRSSFCSQPARGNVTLSYHENARRQLILSERRACEATAPSGGAIHSTVLDMAQWILFNLAGGKVGQRRLISTAILSQIHAPQVVIGDRPLARLPADACYALGWLVDWQGGYKRLSHGGYLHDVSSAIAFYPESGIGLVCCLNLGGPVSADFVTQRVFEVLMNVTPKLTLQQRLAEYEKSIASERERNESAAPVPNTKPSHALAAYTGRYRHPAYGEIDIGQRQRQLWLQFNDLRLAIKHWHHDCWIAQDDERWLIHQPHPFERASPIQFHPNRQGGIDALSIALETEVPPIRFDKVTEGS